MSIIFRKWRLLKMKKKLCAVLLISLITVFFSVSGALAAKLICVSHHDIKGEQSINACLAKGMEFAILDAQGFVRVLTPREIELTKAVNPKAFELKAFGLKYHHLAPVIPPLPVPPESLG